MAKRTSLLDLRAIPGECARCLAAKQLIAGRDLEDEREIADLVDHEAKTSPPVVIFRGQSLCLAHFNAMRSWPENYPDEPLPGVLKKELVRRYREVIDPDEGSDDHPE